MSHIDRLSSIIQVEPHPPIAIPGPNGRTYTVAPAIVIGVAQPTIDALAELLTAKVVAELENRGVIPYQRLEVIPKAEP
jgi:hypothetical protein